MGKQIEFYMTAADEQGFLAALRTLGSLELFWDTSKTAEPESLVDLPAQGSVEARRGVVLVNPDLDGDLVVKRAGEFYYIDKDASPVIEFRRSEPTERGIESGRLWAEVLSDSEPKSEAFANWFEAARRWIRKHYTKDEDGRYIAPGVAALRKRK